MLTNSALHMCKKGTITEFKLNKELRTKTPILLLSRFPFQLTIIGVVVYTLFVTNFIYILINSVITKVHIVAQFLISDL